MNGKRLCPGVRYWTQKKFYACFVSWIRAWIHITQNQSQRNWIQSRWWFSSWIFCAVIKHVNISIRRQRYPYQWIRIVFTWMITQQLISFGALATLAIKTTPNCKCLKSLPDNWALFIHVLQRNKNRSDSMAPYIRQRTIFYENICIIIDKCLNRIHCIVWKRPLMHWLQHIEMIECTGVWNDPIFGRIQTCFTLLIWHIWLFTVGMTQ